jgi:hypothetical protein
MLHPVRYLRNTSGDYVGFISAGHLFTPGGQWLGIVSGHETFDTRGAFIGTLWPDDRLVRNRASGPQRSILRPGRPMRPLRPIPPRRGLFLPRLAPPLEDVFEGLVRGLTELTPAAELERIFAFEGASLIAADGTLLGIVSRDPAREDSLANPGGPFGDPLSERSVFHPGGTYGGAEGALSAFDPEASDPPRLEIAGETVARLSRNPGIAGRVDPNALIAWLAIP